MDNDAEENDAESSLYHGGQRVGLPREKHSVSSTQLERLALTLSRFYS
jgi:hypothetical protein